MALSNFERMLQLADEIFASKTDPDQLDINPGVLDHLQEIHPATVQEYDDGNGPVAWVLIIPTTRELMNQFLSEQISERQLYEQTLLKEKYDAVYLCSAMVLKEYRRKGLSKQLSIEAIEAIRKDHPVEMLFDWPFSAEGQLCAEAIATAVKLPLHHRVAIQKN